MYEQYFRFLNLPFRVTPDPRVFYSNPVYQEAFATLRYGIEARKGFIVITGEVGTGKTTVLKLFMRSVESRIHTAFIFNPKLTFTELLRFSLNDLGVTPSRHDRVALMEQLNGYLIQQRNKGHLVALLLDEAQELSGGLLEELRLLSQTDDDNLIQIVLMGQPELEQRLEQPALRQLKERVALRCRLAPLKGDEVRRYIDFRLKTAHYGGKELFDPAAVERITFYSAGVPRLINVICDNALLMAYAVSKTKVSVEMIEEVARDLKLTLPCPIEMTAHLANPARSEHRDEVKVEETHRRALTRGEKRTERHAHRSRTGVGIGLLLGLVILAGVSALLHDPQGRDYVSGIPAGRQDLFNNPVEQLNPAKLTPEVFKEDYDALADDREVSPKVDRGQAKKPVEDSVPDTAPDVTAGTGRNNLQTGAVKPPVMNQDLEENAARPLGQGEPVKPAVTESRPTQADMRVAGRLMAAEPKAPEVQHSEAHLRSLEDVVAPFDSQDSVKNEQRFFQGTFEVTKDCLLLDKPRREAAVVTTLPSRSWVRVEKKEGNYLFVRSLNDPGIHGYVHLENAFFERIGK